MQNDLDDIEMLLNTIIELDVVCDYDCFNLHLFCLSLTLLEETYSLRLLPLLDWTS